MRRFKVWKAESLAFLIRLNPKTEREKEIIDELIDKILELRTSWLPGFLKKLHELSKEYKDIIEITPKPEEIRLWMKRIGYINPD